jgi:hypothetical protein
VPGDAVQLLANLGLATVMVAVTVLISFFGFIGLTWLMSGSHDRIRPHQSKGRAALLILLVVFGLFGLHTVQIWLYAALFILLGEIATLEEALYFSTVSFSSLGYGDVLLGSKWRLVGAIEGVNGLLLIAWSTSFLLTVTSRLKLLEHEWLEPHKKD